jgi:hypothetical protein
VKAKFFKGPHRAHCARDHEMAVPAAVFFRKHTSGQMQRSAPRNLLACVLGTTLCLGSRNTRPSIIWGRGTEGAVYNRLCVTFRLADCAGGPPPSTPRLFPTLETPCTPNTPLGVSCATEKWPCAICYFQHAFFIVRLNVLECRQHERLSVEVSMCAKCSYVSGR